MDAKTLNIPEEIKREIETFAAEVERLNRGEVGDEDFKRFRLQQGIYGQRQDGEQMVRTKLPAGKITSEQMRCMADFAEKYSHGIYISLPDKTSNYITLKSTMFQRVLKT